MHWLRQLRWKMFISHLMIIAIGIGVFLPTAYFLASNPLVPTSETSINPQVGERVNEVQPATTASALLQSVMGDAMLVAAFASLIAAVVVSLFVSRRIVGPLQELTLVSSRLASGYYRERTIIESDDELAMLSQSINQLAETLDKTEQRRLGLLADMAHELRTPLTTIEGYMEGLIDEVINPEPRIFAMVHHEATRLKWMIEEMALLSRAEAGQLRVEPKPLFLEPLIEQVAEQFRPQMQAQDVQLKMDIDANLPNVFADADRVEQILINLTANALQYSPPNGSITIFAHPEDLMMHVGVVDTGTGIAPEHLPHIFERFYRVDKSRARNSGGAGIGLTIARHLVYAHGGEIWAKSAGLGKGTTVRFTLPIIESVES
ncbi:MAG: HAMP domain-containing protein [Chloroflexi bacterium]|nr:HAMP domain-containing protein [Chloroflexota bacterium]